MEIENLIQYTIKRFEYLNTPDKNIIKEAILLISETSEFKLILLKWGEVLKHLSDLDLEEMCLHIYNIYSTDSYDLNFYNGKKFTYKIFDKLTENNVTIDFEIIIAIKTLALKLCSIKREN